LSPDSSVRYLGVPLKQGTSGTVSSTVKLTKAAIKNLFLFLFNGLSLKYDLIFVGKPLPVSSTAAFILSRLKKKPIHLDCDDYELFTNQTKGRLQHWLIRFYENQFPKICRTVTTHNRFLFARLKNIRRKKNHLFYIPNGIDTDRLQRPENRYRKRQKPGKRILYFGDLNLSTGHSVDVLLKAMSILVHDYGESDVELMVLGDGRDQGTLKKMASRLNLDRHIRWGGRVAPHCVADYLEQADVVVDPVDVHPGNISRCPLKILEAMYMGRPVVTSPIGDRRLLLKDAGIYVKAGNAASMASGLLTVLKNVELRNQLSEKLIARSEYYIWGILAERFDAIFRTDS
jgi:glycosyltransferase involved in cell wall biosynthesis